MRLLLAIAAAPHIFHGKVSLVRSHVTGHCSMCSYRLGNSNSIILCTLPGFKLTLTNFDAYYVLLIILPELLSAAILLLLSMSMSH